MRMRHGWMARGLGLLGFSILLIAGCPSDPPPAPSIPIVAPMTAFPVTSAPIATAAPPPADDDDDEEDEAVCPYPRRCEDGCKRAFFAAMGRPENNWDPSWIPADVATQLGTCAAGCVLNRGGVEGCIGAANEAECACRAACERAANLSGRVSPEASVKIRRAMRNLEAAIAPACL